MRCIGKEGTLACFTTLASMPDDGTGPQDLLPDALDGGLLRESLLWIPPPGDLCFG